MTAIFKRELKSYLTSMVGYLFIFFVLVLTGIYFSAYQLSGGYSKFETTLSALTFVFLIGVPILSMRVLADSRIPEGKIPGSRCMRKHRKSFRTYS